MAYEEKKDRFIILKLSRKHLLFSFIIIIYYYYQENNLHGRSFYYYYYYYSLTKNIIYKQMHAILKCKQQIWKIHFAC